MITLSLLFALSSLAPQGPSQDPGQRPWWEDGDEQLSRLEFGLLFDFFTAFTEKLDSEDSFNEVRVRSAQLHLRAPVDSTASLYATMDFTDPGTGSTFVLREAAANIEDLPLPFWPDNFHLLIGQYYADLGAWNTTLANEFPGPQLDGARRSFFGGNLAVRGLEAHHLIPMRDWNFRWSLGLASEVEGQNVDGNEFGAAPSSAADGFGRFGIQNWAANGRAEAQWDVGDDVGLRAGVSALAIPNEVRFTTVPGLGVARDEVHHLLTGVDAGWRWQPSPEQAHEVSLEVWVDKDEFRSGAPATLVSDSSRGEWLMYDWTMDQHWSVGGLLSHFGQPGLDADNGAHYHAVWGSYRFSSVNEVTLFVSHTNPEAGEQKWYAIGAEWVLSIGATRDTGHRRWL